MFGDGNLNHRIAKKLETLVVEGKTFSLERNARVGERLGEQEAVAELVENPFLKRIHDRNLRSIHHLNAVPRGESVSMRAGDSDMAKD